MYMQISYTDHSKAYMPKMSASTKYHSYLSLMPDDIPDDDDEDGEDAHKRRAKILSDFRALSYDEQKRQRVDWAKDLEATENEIAELKEKLAFKTAWCGILQRNLGISR